LRKDSKHSKKFPVLIEFLAREITLFSEFIGNNLEQTTRAPNRNAKHSAGQFVITGSGCRY
jgi:hypothetical protein